MIELPVLCVLSLSWLKGHSNHSFSPYPSESFFFFFGLERHLILFWFQIVFKGDNLRSESGKQRVILIDEEPHDSWILYIYMKWKGISELYDKLYFSPPFPTVSMKLIALLFSIQGFSMRVSVTCYWSGEESTTQFETKEMQVRGGKR